MKKNKINKSNPMYIYVPWVKKKRKENQKNYFQIKSNPLKISKNPRKIPKNPQKFPNNSI